MLRLICAALFTLACTHTAWADIARPETLDDTLILMRDQFAADPRVTSTNIDQEQRYLSFTLNNGPLQISLPDTIHDTLQNAADAAARENALVQFINFTLAASQAAAPEAPPELTKILPVIRPSGFGHDPARYNFGRKNIPALSNDDEEDEEEYSAPISLPFTADMEVFFVEDSDQVIQFITLEHLDQLGITAQDLETLANNNLQQREWNLKIEGGDGLHILSLDGNFETSFMLNRAFWQGVDVGLDRIVAVVAARDLVLFVDGDEPGAIENLRTLVDPAINSFPNPISETLLKWDNGRWQPLN